MSNRYEVRELLAEGGQSCVYKAWDRLVERDVALKRLGQKHLHHDPTALDRLMCEGTLQAQVIHPNVAAVYDVGIDCMGGYLALELVSGETLEQAVQRRALTAHELDLLVRQVFDALAAIHGQHLIHLDLKPENLMLAPCLDAPSGFQVKIIDFGLAKTLPTPGTPQPPCPVRAVGSVFFMAPERFEKGLLDLRTDLYSLGCVFYYALTQKPPFDGETAPQVIVAHRQHRSQPLANLRPDLPAKVIRWVESLMARMPDDRPRSLESALQSYLAATKQNTTGDAD